MKKSEIDKLKDELASLKESGTIDKELDECTVSSSTINSSVTTGTASTYPYPSVTVTSSSYNLPDANSYIVSLEDTIEYILSGLKDTLSDREVSLRGQLHDLSNEYERLEKELHTTVEKIQVLEQIIENITDKK